MPKAVPKPTTLREMNEALVLGSLRQHELTEAAEKLNEKLQAEIAERKQVEAALRKAEGSYHNLFNSIDEGFCVIEKIMPSAKPVKAKGRPKAVVSDYRYIESNPAFTTQSGLHNVIGKTIRQILPDEHSGWCHIYDTILETGIPKRFERTLLKQKRLLELFAFRVEDDEHLRVAVLFSDITQRKLEEETKKRIAVLAASNKKLEREIIRRQLVEKGLVESELHEKKLRVRTRQLAQQVLNSQEKERLRISRELHDQVVQTLIGINVRLVGLKHEAEKLGPDFLKKLTVAQNLVEASVETVHELSQDLRPEHLDILGFITSLKTLIKSFHEETGILADLTVFSGSEKLADALLTGIYRVLQEALSNISHHAHASKVKIRIEKSGSNLRLIVNDNGKGFGFETGEPSKHGRLGLVGMQERIEMLGGNFDIRCIKGKGTTVTAEVPLGTNPTK
jgi:signal transduction histidine kinase